MADIFVSYARSTAAQAQQIAEALRGLGNSALRMYAVYAPEHRADATYEAEDVAARILALAPANWSALAIRADQLMDSHDFLGAELLIQEAQRGFHGAALPDDLLQLRARFVDAVGRHGEAIEIFREMIRKDPLSFRPSHALQVQLHIMGRTDEEKAEYARSRDLTGEKSTVEALALFRLWNQAEPQEIVAQYRRYVEARLSGIDLPASRFRQLEAALFDRGAARDLIQSAFDDPIFRNPISTVYLAIFACLFGDTDLALAALRRAYVDMGHFPLWLMWYPEAAEARKDPRFKAIVRDLGLYDYWRKSGNWGDFARPLGDDDFEIIR